MSLSKPLSTGKSSFGNFIRTRRLEKGYTLRKFCEVVEISPAFISRMERDEVPAPSEEKIRAMAEALEVDPEELIFMAKRMPEDVKKMIIDRPDIVPILRVASTRTPEDLKRIVQSESWKKGLNL